MILKSSDISRCPKHILVASHYLQDGSCLCPEPAPALTLRAKQEKAVAEHACPLCFSPAGSPCGHMESTRTKARKPLKRPHPERVQLVDPSLAGYRKRAFRSSEEGRNATMSRPRSKPRGWSDTE